MPSGASANWPMSKTSTVPNSSTSSTASTFTPRSTRRYPSAPTTAVQANTSTHQGMSAPVLDSMNCAVVAPKRPAMPICIALYASSATKAAPTPAVRPSPCAVYA